MMNRLIGCICVICVYIFVYVKPVIQLRTAFGTLMDPSGTIQEAQLLQKIRTSFFFS